MKSIEEVSAWIQSRQSLFPAQMQESASIPDEDIWKLLENANYAPSHKRTEPWRYVVFSGQGKKDLFNQIISISIALKPELTHESEKIKKLELRKSIVSHAIAICMKRDSKECIPEFEEEYAVACSVQNMLLSMKALNIIGYWSTGKAFFSPEMKEFLNLKGPDKCLGFLFLGKPKEGLPEINKKQMSSIKDKVIWRK
jgi:nitroreductase